MLTLLIVLAVIALVFLLLGFGGVASIFWTLFWIALIIAVILLIVYLVQGVSGRRRGPPL